MYKEIKIEFTFLEIIKPHKKDKVIDCIYKHPNASVPEFRNDYMARSL